MANNNQQNRTDNSINTERIIRGPIGQIKELRYTPSGMAVMDFGVATSHNEKKGDQWERVTSFVTVTAWGEAAEKLNQVISQWKERGSQVMVILNGNSNPKPRAYNNQAGEPKIDLTYSVNSAFDVRELPWSNFESNGSSAPAGAPTIDAEDIDDIPF